MSGNWVVRIPELQANYSLTKGALGLVLTGGPVGSILMMLIIGSLIGRFGSKNMTIIGTLAFHTLLPLIFLMPGSLMLWIFLTIIGFTVTIMDVSMNSQGIEVERILKTSAMSSFHAFFSIGNVVGALIGGFFISLGIVPAIHFMFVSLAFLPLSLFSFRYLRKERELKNVTTEGRKTKIIQLPPRELWILGLIAFIAVIGEMMIADWGSIFIIQYTKNPATVAALGYAIFALCMTIGRLTGDSLSNHFTNERIVKICGIIGSIGLLLSILTSDLIVILVGFALLGIGISVLIPIIFKVAGNRMHSEIGTGIAGVALFAYAAGIIEPFFVGQVADIFSLKVSFLVIAVSIAMIFFLSKSLKIKNTIL